MFKRFTGYSREDDRNPNIAGSKASAHQRATDRHVLERLRHDAESALQAGNSREFSKRWAAATKFAQDHYLP